MGHKWSRSSLLPYLIMFWWFGAFKPKFFLSWYIMCLVIISDIILKIGFLRGNIWDKYCLCWGLTPQKLKQPESLCKDCIRPQNSTRRAQVQNSSIFTYIKSALCAARTEADKHTFTWEFPTSIIAERTFFIHHPLLNKSDLSKAVWHILIHCIIVGSCAAERPSRRRGSIKKQKKAARQRSSRTHTALSHRHPFSARSGKHNLYYLPPLLLYTLTHKEQCTKHYSSRLSCCMMNPLAASPEIIWTRNVYFRHK